MKKALFIISIGFLFANCGSTKAQQSTTVPANTVNVDTTQIKKDTVKVAVHENPLINDTKEKDSIEVKEAVLPVIEEKAPDTQPKSEDTKKEVAEKTVKEPETPKILYNVLSHVKWNRLLAKYVSTEGKINYQGFKQDEKALKSYLWVLRNNMPANNWSKADKLAYWLNVYNAYTVKLIIDNYPIKSIKDIKKPWDLRFFRLGKKWYTLNDVEHQILRKMKDPRIHFGINCASFSCPPLLNKAFTAKNVDAALEKLAVTFINDPKRNTISANEIEISKIFSWFAKDFKKEGTIINFLNKYSKTKINKSAKKSFKDYNWDLNE